MPFSGWYRRHIVFTLITLESACDPAYQQVLAASKPFQSRITETGEFLAEYKNSLTSKSSVGCIDQYEADNWNHDG